MYSKDIIFNPLLKIEISRINENMIERKPLMSGYLIEFTTNLFDGNIAVLLTKISFIFPIFVFTLKIKKSHINTEI